MGGEAQERLRNSVHIAIAMLKMSFWAVKNFQKLIFIVKKHLLRWRYIHHHR